MKAVTASRNLLQSHNRVRIRDAAAMDEYYGIIIHYDQAHWMLSVGYMRQALICRAGE